MLVRLLLTGGADTAVAGETADALLDLHAAELSVDQQHLADMEEGQLPGAYGHQQQVEGIRRAAEWIHPAFREQREAWERRTVG